VQKLLQQSAKVGGGLHKGRLKHLSSFYLRSDGLIARLPFFTQHLLEKIRFIFI